MSWWVREWMTKRHHRRKVNCTSSLAVTGHFPESPVLYHTHRCSYPLWSLPQPRPHPCK
jgi:hypothetical protein